MVIEDRTLVSANDEDGSVGVPAARGTFEDLFLAERTRLFQALCLVTGDRQEAEDLAQDTFVRVYERWDRIGDMDDPVGYLYRTAMNGYRTGYRRARMALRRVPPAPETPEEFARVEDRVRLLDGLARLTRKQRVAVVLVDLLGFTSQEAGRILGMDPGTVRTQASRARSALRKIVEDDDA
jgi:RNA polymerase sigma-70 factor (ECF subfamily)